MVRFWTFTVKGSGAFPLDMLRYDSCYPASNAHPQGGYNDNLLNLGVCHHEKEYHMEREVVLVKYVSSKKETPTKGRWASFGWKVIKSTYTQY